MDHCKFTPRNQVRHTLRSDICQTLVYKLSALVIASIDQFDLVYQKRKSFLFKFNHPFWLYTQMVILSHIQRLQRMYRAWTQVLNGFHISPESYLQHFVLSHNHKGLCGRSQSHEIIKNGKKESIPGAVNWALWPQFWPFFKSVKSQRPKII